MTRGRLSQQVGGPNVPYHAPHYRGGQGAKIAGSGGYVKVPGSPDTPSATRDERPALDQEQPDW